MSFDYATIEFQLISSNIRLTLQAEINEIAIKMDETCTHYIFKNHLEAFLNKSGDIALMIQVTGSHKYVSMYNAVLFDSLSSVRDCSTLFQLPV